MGTKQEYWNGLPCHLPEDLPNLGIKPRSPALQADSLPAEAQRKLQGRLYRHLNADFSKDDTLAGAVLVEGII